METRAATRMAVILCLTLIAATALVFAATSLHARFLSDDFCYSYLTEKIGILGAHREVREAINGRVATTVALALWSFLGTHAAQINGMAVIAALIGAASFAISRELREMRRKVLALQIALTAIVCTLAALPSTALNQSVYWLSGTTGYAYPLITLLCIYGVSVSPSIAASVSCFVAALTLGTLSEVGAFAQLGFFAICIAVRPSRWRPLSAAILGTLGAILIIAVAPATAMRTSYLPPRPDLFTAIFRSLEMAARFIARSLTEGLNAHALAFVAILLISAAAGESQARSESPKSRSAVRLLLGAIGVWILIGITLFPVAYAYGAVLPPRAFLIPTAMLVAGISLAAWSLGPRVLPRDRPNLILLGWAAASVLAIGVLLNSIQLGRSLRAFSPTWDAAIAEIERAVPGPPSATGERAMTRRVSPFDPWRIVFDHVGSPPAGPEVEVWAPAEFAEAAFLAPDPMAWSNRCVARYYGVGSVQARWPRTDHSIRTPSRVNPAERGAATAGSPAIDPRP